MTTTTTPTTPLSRQRCVLLARTILALGGSASLQRLQAELRVPSARVLARLNGSSAFTVAEYPRECLFAYVLGEWRLTEAGLAAATSDEPACEPAAFGRSPKVEVSKARGGTIKVTCPHCRQRRVIKFDTQTQLATAKARGCRSCSASGARREEYKSVPDAADVVRGDCRLPTQARPGSPMKVAILEERAELIAKGLWRGPLHLPGDAGNVVGVSRLGWMLEDVA